MQVNIYSEHHCTENVFFFPTFMLTSVTKLKVVKVNSAYYLVPHVLTWIALDFAVFMYLFHWAIWISVDFAVFLLCLLHWLIRISLNLQFFCFAFTSLSNLNFIGFCSFFYAYFIDWSEFHWILKFFCFPSFVKQSEFLWILQLFCFPYFIKQSEILWILQFFTMLTSLNNLQ